MSKVRAIEENDTYAIVEERVQSSIVVTVYHATTMECMNFLLLDVVTLGNSVIDVLEGSLKRGVILIVSRSIR